MFSLIRYEVYVWLLWEQSNFQLAQIKLMEEQTIKLDNLAESNEGGPFVKGMSLEEYMAKKVLDSKETPQDEIDTEENLYQSSGNHEMQGLMHRNIDYCINQIDQESVEDSNQSNLEQSFHMREGERPRNLVDIKNAVPVNDWKSKVSNVSMNATAYFKNQRDDRNSFRVKRMSISPSKKQEKNLMNGSITIYGSKFGQVTQKKSINMPEIVTFYGKLSSHQPHKGKDLASSKDKFKKKQMKNTPYRKNQLNLNELLQYESRIKKNRASNTHLQQIKASRIYRINQKINY